MQKLLHILIILSLSLALSESAYCQINPNLNLGINNSPPGSTKEDEKSGDENEIIMNKQPAYTLKRYFSSLAGKDSMSISRMAIGSMILPGTAQIYNKQYNKLPFVYGAIGGFIGGAVAANISYQKSGKVATNNLKNIMIAGAAASYVGSVLDGVICYKSDQKPLPARASLLSALVPGLGQAYNKDYWKIPVFYTGFLISGYCWDFNQTQYIRYKEMYKEATSENSSYTGTLSPENMKWYRDQYRRNRDYSILATALIYALNIIDANVFAHFSNFDISDDISVQVTPAVIEPIETGVPTTTVGAPSTKASTPTNSGAKSYGTTNTKISPNTPGAPGAQTFGFKMNITF